MKYIYKSNIVLFFALFPTIAFAMGSANYSIPADSIDSSGGVNSSTSFSVLGAAGDSFVGDGSSTNFGEYPALGSDSGFSISLELDSVTRNLGDMVPGTPVTGTTVATVNTNASGGYDLAIFQDKNLTHDDASTEIPAYPCSIEMPCAWIGYGLGFTVQSGSDVEAKWSSDPDYHYAAIPDSATIFHAKNSYSDVDDNTTIGYKIDVPIAQKSGGYSNVVTYIATTKI